MTQLDVFMTHCAQCGERFEVKRSAGGISALNRRCAKHRRPGIKVSPRG
ncbi:hypothetical protein MKK63_24020 [Methylobacterium sp. J-088]|nr:hypothetical protein [Methylobacterium sp. J-088]MCJ2065746.1 hypothetical protein [Methylobacterium sp. J-088]